MAKSKIPKWLAWVLVIVLGYVALMVAILLLTKIFSGELTRMMVEKVPFFLGYIGAAALLCWLLYKGIVKMVYVIKEKKNA